MGQVYTAPIRGVVVSTGVVLFNIQAPATNRVRLRELRIGQYSDFGDAEAEHLSVVIIRGQTTFATEGGVEITPVNLHPASRAAGTRVIRTPNLATEGGKTLVADVMNVAAGCWYYPPQCEEIWINPGSNLAVRLSAPADALTMNATMILEEFSRTESE